MRKKITFLLLLLCSLSVAFPAGRTGSSTCNAACTNASKKMPMDNIAISRISIDYFL
jgi:F0F1-type ATP synthase membrane subunit c/vacuolar-type H+-ATPase subunit K